VKGPASLLYGAIPPGGIINFITKKPKAEHGGYVRYSTGTWNYNRIDAESTGPISDDVRYLVNISQEDRDFFWVGQTRKALNILAAVEMDFADKKGNILAEYSHSHVDQAAVQSFTPRKLGTAFGPNGRLADELDLDYPVKNFNARDRGAPQWNESNSLYLKFRYWFNENYTLRAAFRTQETDFERINQVGGIPSFIDERPGQTALQPGDPLYGLTAPPQWDHQGGWGHADNLQVNLLMSYDVDWATFQIMPGLDLNQQDDWFWRFRAGTVGEDGRRNGNFRSERKDIFDPNTWVFDSPNSAQYLADDPLTEEYEGPGLLRNNTGNDGSSDDFYVYGSGNFLSDNLIVTFGYRESSFENSPTTTAGVLPPTSGEIIKEEPLIGDDSIHQYGAVYKLIPEKLHIYGNFAQSFQPQLRTIKLIDPDLNPIDTDLDGDGINESPLVNDNARIPAQHLFGEGWEMGLKGSLGGKGFLTYSAAYFTTTNNNIIRNITVEAGNPAAYEVWFPNLDAATVAAIAALDPTERLDEFQVQSGEEEASGIELELTITPFEGWDIRTTFTHLETELIADESSPAAEGRRLPNSPEYMFNVFTRYAFSGALDGFFIGGSADYMSERFSTPPQAGTAGVRARGRILYNAFAGYRIQSGNLRYRFQLNVQNATDEFVLQGHALGAFYPPRHYRLSAGIDF